MCHTVLVSLHRLTPNLPFSSLFFFLKQRDDLFIFFFDQPFKTPFKKKCQMKGDTQLRCNVQAESGEMGLGNVKFGWCK